MTHTRFTLAAALVAGVLFLPAAAHGDVERELLNLDLNSGYSLIAEPEAGGGSAAGTGEPSAAPAREARFGRAGSRWWSVGPAIASDFSDATDVNVHGFFSQFLADELEFGIEAAGWYFSQDGDDTGGVSGSMLFRWHALHDEEFSWSIFGEVGIGLLGAFDDVPDGGTSFNFMPRAGAGFTRALDPADPSGARFTLGLRWHHISNARIEGNADNPARDGLLLFAEIQFPF